MEESGTSFRRAWLAILSLMLRSLSDDGFFLPAIKEHSLEKIVRHDYYANLFSTGMKSSWHQRAYIGLYSGAGRARIENTGEIIETTAMSVFRLKTPFTKYIFVDADEHCTTALSARIRELPTAFDVSVLTGDVNAMVQEIRTALPRFSRVKRLLSFCFVDPFAANLKFATIRELAAFRMDFLLLLMIGRDARANFRLYFQNEDSTRIAELIDCADWRAQYRKAEDKNIVRFVLGKFDEAMQRIGYRGASGSDYHSVNVTGKGVMQYILVLYSKHELGQKYWGAALSGTSPQLGLDLTR
jgi:three-Cys-motif partner protein